VRTKQSLTGITTRGAQPAAPRAVEKKEVATMPLASCITLAYLIWAHFAEPCFELGGSRFAVGKFGGGDEFAAQLHS